MTWPFGDPPNITAYTSRDIVEMGLPILLVTHNADDGAWQFHSENGAPASTRDARMILLKNILARDPSIGKLADLPLGWRASRARVGEPWLRFPDPPRRR